MKPTHRESAITRFSRWTISSVVVLGLHAGVAAYAFMTTGEQHDEELVGAMVIELAAVAMAPADEHQDLAVGQRSEDSEASPPVAEEVKETKPEEAAEIEESPAVPEPDLALPFAKPEEKVEEVEDSKPQEAQPTQASVPSLAAAPPPIEAAVPAPAPAAPVQGTSHKPSRTELTWQRSLLLHLSRHKRYPAEARRASATGTTVVAFRIDRSGGVMDVALHKGSGNRALDEEALELLRRASPLPTPPGSIPQEALTMIVPVKFALR